MASETEQRFERIERKLEQVAEGLAALTAHASYIDGRMTGLLERMDQQTEGMVKHDILLNQLMEAQLRTESNLDRLTGKVDEIDRRGGK
jgi:septation ring formation regulator EzrA